MTELKDQQANPAAGNSAGAADDPLARLHRMSTTAGITSQEYVAINLPSVIATLLGLASLLAKLDLLFLIIPLLGVIVGSVSLLQIRRSNGTQTGHGFAIAGIVLSILIGGVFVGTAVYERFAAKSDERVMIDKMLELGEKLKAQQYPAAYDLFNDRFKARVKPDAFEARFRAIEKEVALKSFDWNGVPPMIEADPDAVTRVGSVIAKVSMGDAGGATRWPVSFRDAGGGWMLDDLPTVFPAEGPPGGRRGR